MLDRLIRLLLAPLCAFLLVCCSSSGPAAVSGPTNGQAPPAIEDYLDSVLPGFGRSLGLGDVDAELYSPLVRQFRERGLEALTDDERRDLLLVAQGAFLSHAQTLRYLVTSQDVSPGGPGGHDGQATVEEVYVQGTLPYYRGGFPHEPLALLLGGAHVESENISWFAGLWPGWDAEASGEWLVLADFAGQGKEARLDSGVLTYWLNHDGDWKCLRDDLATADLYQMLQLGRAENSTFARGTLLGRDTLDGRAVYRFEGQRMYGVDRMQYWLDAETLWLRQYEFEWEDIYYLVKLEAVNEDITVEAPEVDVECVEEQAEEAD